MTTETAVLYFRYCPPEDYPPDVSTYLQENTREVANALPHHAGVGLFYWAGQEPPEFYAGQDEPTPAKTLRDRGRYDRLRIERGEVSTEKMPNSSARGARARGARDRKTSVSLSSATVPRFLLCTSQSSERRFVLITELLFLAEIFAAEGEPPTAVRVTSFGGNFTAAETKRLQLDCAAWFEAKDAVEALEEEEAATHESGEHFQAVQYAEAALAEVDLILSRHDGVHALHGIRAAIEALAHVAASGLWSPECRENCDAHLVRARTIGRTGRDPNHP